MDGVPGNQELSAEELSELLGGELPATLPLEGWRTVSVHCQVDSIGPSERHPDLVKVELSFPPEKASKPCARCHDKKVIPPPWHCEEDGSAPCPVCSACTATALHAVLGRVRCALPAGHYDEERRPASGSGEPFPRDPGGWHQSARDREGLRLCWADTADSASPHGAVDCPACGPTVAEEHPRIPRLLRCANCKEHLPLAPAGRGEAS
ncbi:hypothetical protein ACFW5V_31855 [Streptomyces sp. NPDC058762]|uniref:hypothetical protein n=1 Tax=Streptomyces sp. NPDC058762 TaxID=3346629 RepID=UPI0036AB169C